MFAHFQNEKWKQIWKHKFINITITWKVHWIESSQLTVQIIIAVIEVTSLVLTWGITATLLSGEPKRKVINYYYVSSIKHQIITKNTKKMSKITHVKQRSTYRKFPPNPLLCCSVWANISYFLMSLSLTDRRANFIDSSKCALVISGTGSKSSTSWKKCLSITSHIKANSALNWWNSSKRWSKARTSLNQPERDNPRFNLLSAQIHCTTCNARFIIFLSGKWTGSSFNCNS